MPTASTPTAPLPTAPPRGGAPRSWDSILERHAWRWMSLLLVFIAAISAFQSQRLKLWMDELITFHVAHLATPSAIVAAIRDGCDAQPPLYALIVHATRPVFGEGPLALRLPSLAGFCVMCWCVFAMCRRRLGAAYALVATLMVYQETCYFATEARSYGAVLGCTALAFLCWQAATDRSVLESRRRRLAIGGLFVSLALAMAFQYSAAFIAIPLLGSELLRLIGARKPDVPVLAAILASPLVLLPHRSLIEAGRQFTPYYWSKASLASIPETYWVLVSALAPCAALAPCVIYIVWRSRRKERRPANRTANQEGAALLPPALLPAHERAAISILAALPVIVVAIALFTFHAFTPRYVMPAAIGIAVLTTAAIAKAARSSNAVAGALLVILCLQFGARSARSLMAPRILREGEPYRRDLAQVPAQPAAILVPNDHAFLELWYYEPALRGRLVYPVSPDLSRRYTGTDTSPLLLSAMSRHSPLSVTPYPSFIGANPSFLICAGSWDWMLRQLAEDGFEVQMLEPFLYEARLKPEARVKPGP